MRRSSRRAVAAFAVVAAILTLATACGSHPAPAATATASSLAPTPSAPRANATATAPYPTATPYPLWLQDASFINASAGWAIRQDESDVWHTSDAGTHWSHIGSVDLSPQFIAFRDSAHGLIAGVRQPDCHDSCDPAAAATDDGGATWHSVTLPGVASRLSFSGTVARIHVKACQTPCTPGSPIRFTDYTSSDEGASWQEVPHPPIDPEVCKNHGTGPSDTYWLDPTDGWLLCIGQATGTIQAKQLFATVDGGATWTLISQQTFPALPTPGPDIGELPGPGVSVMLFRGAQDGWMGTEEPGQTLQRTSDGGRTWTPVEGDTRVQRITFLDENDGYVVMHYGLWWTSDGGDHWRRLPLP